MNAMQALRLYFSIFSKTTFWTYVVYDLDGSIFPVTSYRLLKSYNYVFQKFFQLQLRVSKVLIVNSSYRAKKSYKLHVTFA